MENNCIGLGSMFGHNIMWHRQTGIKPFLMCIRCGRQF